MEQRTLTIDGRVIYCYEDGSVEWSFIIPGWRNYRTVRTFGPGLYRGYRHVRINQKTYRVHRLIAMAFIPNPKNLPQVDHINRDRSDNRPSNLRWVTNETNQCNTERHDRSKERFGISSSENRKEYIRAMTRERAANKKNITFNDGKRHYVLNELAAKLMKMPISERIYSKTFLGGLLDANKICQLD